MPNRELHIPRLAECLVIPRLSAPKFKNPQGCSFTSQVILTVTNEDKHCTSSGDQKTSPASPQVLIMFEELTNQVWWPICSNPNAEMPKFTAQRGAPPAISTGLVEESPGAASPGRGNWREGKGVGHHHLAQMQPSSWLLRATWALKN